MEFDVKEFVVNKNSWHYRWMLFYNYVKDINTVQHYTFEDLTPQSWFEKKYYQPRDFCSYWRSAIIFPIMRIMLNVLLIIPSMVAFGVVIYAMSINPLGTLSILGMIVAGIIFVVLLFLFVGFVSVLLGKVKDKGIPNDNLIYVKYKSFKDKTCPMIKYDGE